MGPLLNKWRVFSICVVLVLVTITAFEPIRHNDFVDFDDDPVDAAVRECREENGLEVEITGLLDVIAGREHEHGADIVIVYRARLVGGELRADDDVDRVDFFALPKNEKEEENELPPLAFRATQIALDKWRNSPLN